MIGRRTVIVVIAAIVVVVSVVAWKYSTPASFTLKVIRRPRTPLGTDVNVLAVAGQKCVFLVGFEDGEGWLQRSAGVGEAVDVAAEALGQMANVSVSPLSVILGEVAEVTVIPSIASVNKTLSIAITGERHGMVQTETVSIEVIPGEDDLLPHAEDMRDMFIPWLMEEYPELGITTDTEWTGTIVNPRILVVMHYLFYSEDWEMYVTWHVTIPPHDWTRIYLRQRLTATPTYAFEVSSVTTQDEPTVIEIPDWV